MCNAIFSHDFNRATYSVARRAQKLAEMGAIFFTAFSFFSLIAMAIAGPVLTATAINSEKLHKTLPVLLMTPISAWQIVAGKLFSRLLIALTLLGLSLPVLAIVRLLGGVEISQMFGVIVICISIAIFTASIGLFLSTFLSRAYSVILLSYAFLGFLYMFLPFVIGMIVSAVVSRSNAGPGFQRAMQTMMEIAAIAHPGIAIALLAVPDRPPFRLPSWEWCALVHFAAAAILTFLSALQLRRMARREAEGASPSPTSASLPPPSAFPVAPPTFIPNVPAPLPEFPTSPAHQPSPTAHTRAVSDNPVLWRETRRPLFGRRWQGIAAGAITIVFLLFVYVLMSSNNALSDADAQIPFSFIFCAMLNILACVIAATAIAQEKESNTWTLLMATPLTASSIVLGKLLGILRRLAPFTAIIIIHFLLFALGGVIDFASFAIVVWMTITTNLIWVALGLYLSLRIKRVTFAVMLNLSGPIVLYLVPLAILAILFAASNNNDDIMEVVGLYAPYPYMAIAIDHLNSNYHRDLWLPVLHHVDESTFFTAAFMAGIGHILASSAIVLYTIRRFDRIVGRASQSTPLPPPHSPLLAATG
jgi:ABC-type transport system involved in multi-copper enzyme maturation permease subunit